MRPLSIEPIHLFVALSGHGFGHVSQAAPVINELRARIPRLQLTIQSIVPRSVIASRIKGDFELIAEAPDVGMVMETALDVRVGETCDVYWGFHADWQQRLDKQCALLQATQAELVLADVPYLPLAAAERMSMPAVALCSLNWADVLSHYAGAEPGMGSILRTIRAAYQKATAFLRVEPGMPMSGLENVLTIGPIATTTLSRRKDVECKLGLAASERLVLVSLGGIDTQLPFECWPALPQIRWLIPGNVHFPRSDVVAIDSLGMAFTEVLASCDALITKPGYSSFTEAVCNGVPVLFVERGDWPEGPYLEGWLRQYGNGAKLSRDDFYSGQVLIHLKQLWSTPDKRPPPPTGASEAADYLEKVLKPSTVF